jgi:hypothetical protein
MLQRGRYIPKSRISKKGEFFVPARDGDKLQARARINHAIQIGLIPNPNSVPCMDCGHLGQDRRHEYDHPFGYSAKQQMAVEPVCSICHHKRTITRGELIQRRDRKGRYIGRKNKHSVV